MFNGVLLAKFLVHDVSRLHRCERPSRTIKFQPLLFWSIAYHNSCGNRSELRIKLLFLFLLTGHFLFLYMTESWKCLKCEIIIFWCIFRSILVLQYWGWIFKRFFYFILSLLLVYFYQMTSRDVSIDRYAYRYCLGRHLLSVIFILVDLFELVPLECNSFKISITQHLYFTLCNPRENLCVHIITFHWKLNLYPYMKNIFRWPFRFW